MKDPFPLYTPYMYMYMYEEVLNKMLKIHTMDPLKQPNNS